MSAPLNVCNACGFVVANGFDCAVCAVQADALERELKRWIAGRYIAKNPELRPRAGVEL